MGVEHQPLGLLDIAAEADDWGQAFAQRGVEEAVDPTELFFLEFARLEEDDFLADEWQEMAAGHLVSDVSQVGEIHPFPRPAGTALDMAGGPHPVFADDGVDPLLVRFSGDGVGGALPIWIPETEGI